MHYTQTSSKAPCVPSALHRPPAGTSFLRRHGCARHPNRAGRLTPAHGTPLQHPPWVAVLCCSRRASVHPHPRAEHERRHPAAGRGSCSGCSIGRSAGPCTRAMRRRRVSALASEGPPQLNRDRRGGRSGSRRTKASIPWLGSSATTLPMCAHVDGRPGLNLRRRNLLKIDHESGHDLGQESCTCSLSNQ